MPRAEGTASGRGKRSLAEDVGTAAGVRRRGAGDGGGAVAGRGRRSVGDGGGAVTVNVNLSGGPIFLDDERRIRALAKEIKRLIGEDGRRGLGVGG